jgi:hypothetical protein
MTDGLVWSAALRAAIDELPALDQHAHLLSGRAEPWPLAGLLSESRDPAQWEEGKRHPAYRRALRDLAAALAVEPHEDALAAIRHQWGAEALARRLLAACRLETVLVDDGFPVPDALDLGTQAELSGCPVRRVVRIETEAEAAAEGWPAFTDARERFRAAVSGALEAGAAALKTVAAYRCGLDLPRPDAEEARAAYGDWRGSGNGRLIHPALVAFFAAEALEVARERPVPLQVHTGLGDADLDLHRADPSLLGPLVADAAGAGVPVVLLHCYPFVRQAAWLASVHAHVHLDLSLALLLAGHRGTALVLEALELAPVGKLLFATDASRAPEIFFLAARWWRDALAGALSHLVAERSLEEGAALEWAGLVLAGNARRLYGSGAGVA